MRRPTRSSRNAWRVRWTGAERLGVDAIPRDAQRCKAGSQIVHEGRRSANVEITIVRQIKLLKHFHVHPPASVEIDIGPILGIGRAIANVAVMVGKRLEQFACLPGKRVFAAVTGSV
jgi:hypothetical protein